MATTTVTTPLGGGTIQQAINTPHMQSVEITPGVWFNLWHQNSPEHTFAHISLRDAQSGVHTNQPAYLFRGNAFQMANTRVFRVSDTKVIAFHTTGNQLQWMVFTVNPVDYSIVLNISSAMGSVTPGTINYMGDMTQVTDTTWLILCPISETVSGTSFYGGLVALNTTNNNVSQTITITNYSVYQQYAGQAAWIKQRNNEYMVAGNQGDCLTFTTAGTMSTATVGAVFGVNNGGHYVTKLETGELISFDFAGKAVTYKANINAAVVSTGVMNAPNVGAFDSNATNYTTRRLFALDANHFALVYMEHATLASDRQPFYRGAMGLPTKLHVRYVRKLNPDVWEVSANSTAAGGLVITLPVDADTAKFRNFAWDSRALTMDANGDFYIAYPNGNKVTRLKIS